MAHIDELIEDRARAQIAHDAAAEALDAAKAKLMEASQDLKDAQDAIVQQMARQVDMRTEFLRQYPDREPGKSVARD